MKRVLLTGASGFIGAHAIAALAGRGFDIHAAGRTAPADPRAAFHRVDLLDSAGTREVVREVSATHLLHLAWQVQLEGFWQAPENLDWVGASLLLLRAFAEAGGRRAVLAGSCAEYAWVGDGRLGEDLTPCVPATLYGVAKNATREVAEAYAMTTGLSLGWGRIFFVYGPGEKSGRLVSGAIAALRAGEVFPATEGSQRRDFLHVADVAGAFAAFLDGDVHGAVNIGSGAATTIRSMLSHIGDLLGRPDLVQFGARPMPANEAPSIEACVERLRQEVGYTPRFDLAEGLRDAVAHWRSRSAPDQ